MFDLSCGIALAISLDCLSVVTTGLTGPLYEELCHSMWETGCVGSNTTQWTGGAVELVGGSACAHEIYDLKTTSMTFYGCKKAVQSFLCSMFYSCSCSLSLYSERRPVTLACA